MSAASPCAPAPPGFRRHHVACPVLGLLIGLAAAAHAGPAGRDTFWTSADAASHPVREVAVLPVVNVVDDAGASLFVENILGPHFCWRTRLSWLMPDAARRLLTRRTRHPYAQLDSLAHQVWLQGRLDSLTAGDVARQLGVPCVWCIRIDRWERLEAWDTRQVRAFVALRSAVVDTAGRVLWASGGESSSPTSLRFQAELAEVERRPGTPDWGVPLSTAELRRAPDFDQAVSDLLERWAHRFPLRRP